VEEHGNLSGVLILISALGIGAQWLAWTFRLPAIGVFTVAGILIGPVAGLVHPSEQFGPVLRPMVAVAVALILFEGGLSLRFHEFREAAAGVKRLVTVGVLLSWVLGAAAAHWLGGLGWPVALLLGAILVVTGPTVIVPLLRQARLARRPASFLKWEGIINDPIGAMLAVLVFEFFALSGIGSGTGEARALAESLLQLGLSVLVAVALGVGVGLFLRPAFRREWVPEFLKAPVVLAAALVVFGLNNLVLPESGLLATTILGVVVGNTRDVGGIESVRRFNENLTVILVSAIFVLLTADLDYGLLTALDWRAVALLAAVLFAVRPAAVWLSTIGTDMSWQERVLVGWTAPRGIVAAVVAGFFGPQLVERGFAGAEMLVPLVFAVILLTVVLHGFSVGWLARRLGLAAASKEGVLIVGATDWSTDLAHQLRHVGVPVLLSDANWYCLREAAALNVPVHRGEILSGTSEEELDLYEIGYVLATTGNDAYNALVCTHFAADLGYERVYQLAMHEVDVSDPEAPNPEVHGRIAIGEWAYHEELNRRYRRGWRIHTTRLGQEAGAEASAALPRGAELVLVVRENGALSLRSVEHEPEPEPGDIVVALVPPARKMQAAG
jgi:NhaP-type Na+/H+ or K+/H+ antiporter